MYEEPVENRCAESGESITSIRRLVLKTINKRLLKSFSEFELHIAMENMTEEKLLSAIENSIRSVINDTIPDVIGIMAHNLNMDLNHKVVKARVLAYFDSMEKIIEVHSLGKCLKDNTKLKCKVIVENLRPTTLKEQANPHRPFDVVKQEAIWNQQVFDMYQYTGKRDNSNRETKSKKKHPDNLRMPPRGDDRQSAVKPPPKKRDGLPPNDCLHCKGSDLWLEDCPTATEVNKKEAIKTFLDNKKRMKGASSAKRLATNDSLGVSEVIFNNIMVIPYCLDNGATHNVVPRAIVNELQLLDSTDPPVEDRTVGGAVITLTESVDLNIGLQAVAGKVNIRGLTCVITETEEDEFLLGQRTLKSLGIDIDELLTSLVTRGLADIDPFDDERDYQAIARPDTDAIKSRLREIVVQAVDNGFPGNRSGELYDIVSKRVIWRLQISDDPPARLPPFTIRLKEGTEPYRCKPRKYAPAQREFLRDFNDKVIKLGWAYKDPRSRWACPALPVRKSGNENEWRQTTDFRPVNTLIQPLAGGMTNNETHLEDVRGKEHKQSGLHQQLFPIGSGIVIDSIYSLLEKYGVILGMDKTCLYTTAKWCGRVLTKDGAAYDSGKIQALVEMQALTTAGALQQFLCATGWMRSSLVDFARICQPLQDRLNKALAGTRLLQATNIPIELTPIELESFGNVKNLLQNAATLALPDPAATICMYSDASEEGWSIILTMVKNWSTSTAVADQHHDLLHCMSQNY